jgi:hypothetical protein
MDVSSRTLCVLVAVAAVLAAGCGSHSRGGSAAPSAANGQTTSQTAGHASAATGQTTSQTAGHASAATGHTAPQTAGHAARHSAGHAAHQTVRDAVALAPARKYLVGRARTPHDDDEASEYVRPAHNRTSSYRVTLSGARRGAPGHSGGGGATAVVMVRPNRVCWRFGTFPRRTVASRALGRTRVALTPSTAAIRSGARGSSGPVVVVLGARFAQRGCIVVRPVVANSIAAAPRYYYLSVVTARDRTGAFRGQL